jgi:hypothetical protein
MVVFLVLLLRVMSLLQKKSTKNHHTQSHLSLLLSLTCVSLRLFSLHFVREEKKKNSKLFSLSLFFCGGILKVLLWRVAAKLLVVVVVSVFQNQRSHTLTLSL